MLEAMAIIPAHDEEARVAAVIRPCLESGVLSRVVVVDDGSTDGTAEAARAAGAWVVRLDPNRGKAGAMDAGVRAFPIPVVLFLDADLLGVTPEHVRSLVVPVADDAADMTVGTLHSVRHPYNSPILSGQRGMHRITWLRMMAEFPDVLRMAYGIEIACGRIWRLHRLRMQLVELDGLDDSTKGEKWGPVRGAITKARMWHQILRTVRYLGKSG